jgi:ATP-dependent Clp protease ATP-binding subunit ClpC
MKTLAVPKQRIIPMRQHKRAAWSRTRAVRPMAIFERFTEKCIKGLMLSHREAAAFGSDRIAPVHVFLGLFAAECMNSSRGFMDTGIELPDAREAVERVTGVKRTQVPKYVELDFDPVAREILQTVHKNVSGNYVGFEHVFLGISEDPVVAQTIALLEERRERKIEQAVRGSLDSYATTMDQEEQKKERTKSTKTIEAYCTDLCEAAREGRLDPLIGRRTELDRVVQILGRRTKNNPILLGDPGVGKTAIAEGLAYEIVYGTNVPSFLRNKRVLLLDLTGMVAGTKERGEFEQRLTDLVAELKDSKDSVVVIDEIHTLVNVGSGEGQLNASNMLKPALARGQFQCIGATTLYEFRKYIESDAALERRFQPVLVEEPSPEETREILGGLCARYESHHGIAYDSDVLDRIIELSQKIGNRKMPDKAIDMMDELGSYVRSKGASDGSSLKDARHWQQLVAQGRYEELRELELPRLPVATLEDVERVAEAMTGIPRSIVDQRDTSVRKEIEEALVGQQEAIDAVVAAMQRGLTGFRNPKRPVACFLFAGPPGVGKTEMAKVMARVFCSGALLRFDMSEFMEPHSISKLLGSPPGYVGYEEEGDLTDRIRSSPNSVVLFDEIEKAHPKVLNVLLQVMEDGRLTDAKGRVVSFRHALIVLTSNLGTQHDRSSGSSGSLFSDARRGSGGDTMDAIRRHFRPELINRFDDIVVFRTLTKNDLCEIVSRELARLVKVSHDLGIHVYVRPETVQDIVSRAWTSKDDQERGARGIRRLIATLVEDPVSTAILAEQTAIIV